MTQSHVLGRNYEYRLRDWFRDRGWESERNPLSGASEQIVNNLGKHDVRVLKDGIFLQLECKKTNKKNGILNIKKEWIDKIDFNNDEFLIFSYKNCFQHFCLFPEKYIIDKLNKSDFEIVKEIIKVSGKKQFGMNRGIIEKNKKKVFRIDFDNIFYCILDLEDYISLREKFGPSNVQNFYNKISFINDINELKIIYEKEKNNLTTTEHKEYYIKLEKLENIEKQKVVEKQNDIACLCVKKVKTAGSCGNIRGKNERTGKYRRSKGKKF